MSCPLCETHGGRLVFEGAKFRVIHAGEAGFPAFYRVVWRTHVAEFSDLSHADRALCIEAVTIVEQCLREQLAPDKINLAALGNLVPHLHWHVIARFAWDSHFPSPVWSQAQRSVAAERLEPIAARLPAIERAIVERMAARLGALA